MDFKGQQESHIGVCVCVFWGEGGLKVRWGNNTAVKHALLHVKRQVEGKSFEVTHTFTLNF